MMIVRALDLLFLFFLSFFSSYPHFYVFVLLLSLSLSNYYDTSYRHSVFINE